MAEPAAFSGQRRREPSEHLRVVRDQRRQRETFTPRRALRRAGMTVRETSALGGRAAGGTAKAAGFDAGGWTALLLYMLSSIILLALLKTALEGRGPAAVEKSLGFLGGAWGRLFSPEDPILGSGPAEAPGAAAAGTAVAAAANGAAGLGASAVGRYVKVAAGANRPGVSLKPEVIAFVGAIGAALHEVLTIGTGTNHSRLTVNGNVSDHWDGWAGDILARGAENVRIGREALILAGMPPARANRINGGLYNVGAYQIIFNVNSVAAGGDHTDHVHVGIRHH